VDREVNGVRLTYEITGAGPWLVLAHSLGMRGKLWYQQVPLFAQQYRVLTYDARGNGNSEKPAGPYSFELLAGDLYQLLLAEGIAQTAAVGLSLGGKHGASARGRARRPRAGARPLGYDGLVWAAGPTELGGARVRSKRRGWLESATSSLRAGSRTRFARLTPSYWSASRAG